MLGVEVFPAASADEARDMLDRISRNDDFASIFIIEDLAVGSKDIVDRISKQVLPSLVIVPGKGKGAGSGVTRMQQLVRRASGQDVK